MVPRGYENRRKRKWDDGAYTNPRKVWKLEIKQPPTSEQEVQSDQT